jgi:thiamine biosynthesis protein ThiC
MFTDDRCEFYASTPPLPRATTDIGSGYDHITSSMGAAMISKARFDRADGDQAR